MHASIEQLLSLRDGPGDENTAGNGPNLQGVKQHVSSCTLCGERLDELVSVRDELNRLPVQGPQRDHWPEILEAAGYQRTPAGRSRFRWYAAAGMAASVLLAAVIVINQQSGAPVTPEDRMADAGLADEAPDKAPRKWTTEEIEALVARSQRLEQTLGAMPRRPSVKRASTSDTIMGLQQSIAMVDYQINYSGNSITQQQSQRLWQQRVDLMNSLVNVRYAETRPRRVASR